MATGVNRRSFLKGSASASLMLCMGQLSWAAGAGRTAFTDLLAGENIVYDGFQDLYREKWQWDRIAKSTHFVNCWYQRNCSWNVYVKNNIVWREEQSATYEQVDPNVPDLSLIHI